MTINKDKCVSIFLLHALGDTIGFKNGIWEFNYNNHNISDIRVTIEIISEFISLGGISHIDLSGWNISDDTLFNYEIAKFILPLELKDNKLTEDDIFSLKKDFAKLYKSIERSEIDRGIGRTTRDSINKFTKEIDERNEPYNINSGGNGCSMRTLSIGIKYHKDDDLDKLIETSIITSKITHNSPLGFLGGLETAYFIKLAINGVNINKWPSLLIKLLESPKVKKYIDLNDDNIFFDYRKCIKIWKKYLELFFNSDQDKPLNLKSSSNLISRFKTFLQLDNSITDKVVGMVGGNGQSSVIMAYNAVLDCDGNWEKLVYYSMLHGGDSDTVGAIAAGIYGALYGTKDVGEHLLKHLEMKKELIEIGEKYYDLLK